MEMIIKYRTRDRRDLNIERVEVSRETAKMVFFDSGRREAKQSDWFRYFNTWEEAHNHVLALARQRVRTAQAVLEAAEGALYSVENTRE